MFKKNKKGIADGTPKNIKLKNTVALKRGIYSIILSVVFIVGVVLAILLSTALADRYPIELDLTANKIHSMTDDNVHFIKGVDKRVNIYVCLTEEEYNCTSSSSYNMCYYAAQNYFVDYNTDNAKYFTQTVEILRKYEQYNDNIKVTFLDIAQPSAAEITDDFEDYNWAAGDILVESTFSVDGKDITRRTAIPFNDVYTLEAGDTQTESYQQYAAIQNYALYGYGLGYLIMENNIEYAVSAAVYKVISETTPVFLVPSSYCDTESVKEALEKTLTTNNFTVEYKEGFLSGLLTSDKFDSYSGIILSNCSSDISADDRVALEAFLNNGGKKGKSVFYFAGTNTYKLTNLCAFMGDWGIGFESGILYETDKNVKFTDSAVTFLHSSLQTDYTKSVDAMSDVFFAAKNSVPMKSLYANGSNVTANHVRKSTITMRTMSNGTVTVMPIDADPKTWTPASDARYDAYPTMIVTEDSDTDENNSYIYSSVIAVASSDFISEEWANYNSYISNLNLTLDVFNFVTGNTENPFNFVAKTITNERFYSDENNANAVKVIFMGVVPVLLVASGVTVWIRRKSK